MPTTGGVVLLMLEGWWAALIAGI